MAGAESQSSRKVSSGAVRRTLSEANGSIKFLISSSWEEPFYHWAVLRIYDWWSGQDDVSSHAPHSPEHDLIVININTRNGL